jgi:hypothetical protein
MPNLSKFQKKNHFGACLVMGLIFFYFHFTNIIFLYVLILLFMTNTQTFIEMEANVNELILCDLHH